MRPEWPVLDPVELERVTAVPSAIGTSTIRMLSDLGQFRGGRRIAP
jgi:hypothetical protein